MSKVSIVPCNDYQIGNVKAAVARGLDYLGGMERYVSQGTRVVLKPNLLMEKKPEDAATTHPALVQAVAELVRQAGGDVVIAESPGGPYTESVLDRIYAACGMIDAAQQSGAELNRDISSVEVGNPQGKYLKKVNVIRPLAEADLIINLPKLKTHGQMVYTGAVKNMFGAVPGLEKAEYHMRMPKYEDFADALIDIFLSVKPTLNIMDAIIGMDGAGPSAGRPKPIGLVLASADAFALDYAALRIIGADPKHIPIIKQAGIRGLAPKRLDDIEWLGEALESIRMDEFQMPQLDQLKTIAFVEKGPLKPLMKLITPKPFFDKTKCIGCADCAKNCPVKIIKMKDKRPQPDLAKCIRCFCCQELCPAKAVTIKRSKLGEYLMTQGASSLINLVNKIRGRVK